MPQDIHFNRTLHLQNSLTESLRWRQRIRWFVDQPLPAHQYLDVICWDETCIRQTCNLSSLDSKAIHAAWAPCWNASDHYLLLSFCLRVPFQYSTRWSFRWVGLILQATWMWRGCRFFCRRSVWTVQGSGQTTVGRNQSERHSVASIVRIPLASYTKRRHSFLLFPNKCSWLSARIFGASTSCWRYCKPAWYILVHYTSLSFCPASIHAYPQIKVSDLHFEQERWELTVRITWWV